VQIFALKNASAESAAEVIRQLVGDESIGFRLSVDRRTNSLIVTGDQEQLAGVEAVLSRLDTTETQRADQPSNDEKQSDPSSAATAFNTATKYDTMDKQPLQEELKRLQRELLVAEEIAQQAAGKARNAARVHQMAADDEKPEALLRKIEAEAASQKPTQAYKRLRSDLSAAERAYYRLLVAE
jgi:hypothetical protein